MNARTARVLARAPLGAIAEKRYGAPYWVIHRGDLQAVLIDAVRVHPGIVLNLGARVEDFVLNEDGVTVFARSAQHLLEDRGVALIGADGLWSGLRQRLGHRRGGRFSPPPPRRALAPAAAPSPRLPGPRGTPRSGTQAPPLDSPGRRRNDV